jgi:hypothetical protein
LEEETGKIHYYDVSYGGVFTRQTGKGAKVEGKFVRNESENKKLKLKGGSVIESSVSKMLSEDQSFRKYIMFLTVLLSCSDTV